MHNPLVSIIMPAYNSDRYIAQAINSVIKQTYANWELIIIDDCSSDNTKQIISKFSHLDNRIKPTFNSTNSGKPSIAKNLAFDSIKGEYIAFLDSDDMWDKSKLSKQVSYMQNNLECKLCYTGGYFIDEYDNIFKSFLPKYHNGYNLKNMLRRYEINNQSVMILRDVLQKFNEHITIGEDYNLFMRIVADCKSCSIKEKLISYRIHKKSITKSKKQVSDGVLTTLKELNLSHKIFLKHPLYCLLTYLKAIRFKFISK